MPDPISAEDAPQGTRLALIEAGFDLFGTRGFDGTSTRELAARAGTNVASIAYHFGGKDGLRDACADEFARRLGQVMGRFPVVHAPTPDAARGQLRAILGAMVAYVVGGREAQGMVAFVLRELVSGGPIVDRIYGRLIDPAHRRLCALWAVATGQEADSESVRLSVFSVIGMVVYFRIGAPVVARRMGWPAIGPAEAARIADRIAANLDTLLDAAREPQP